MKARRKSRSSPRAANNGRAILRPHRRWVDASDGLSWANAFATITQFASIDAAGETCYVADDYSHNLTVDTTWAFAGTLASPTRLICVDDTGDPSPPTALATCPGITGNDGVDLTIKGSVYLYGIPFVIGLAATSISFTIAPGSNQKVVAENCVFHCKGTNTGSTIRLGDGDASAPSEIELIDCDIKFGSTGQGIWAFLCSVSIRGGAVLSGGSTPVTLFESLGITSKAGPSVFIDSYDFSNFSAGVDFFDAAPESQIGELTINACKLPASWSGTLFSSTPACPMESEMIASGDYKYRKEADTGTIIDENTIKPTTTNAPFTLEMATTSTPVFPFNGLRSPWFSVNNTTTGSSVTVSIEFVHDSVTNLQDDEIGIEVEGLATSGSTISTLYRSEAGILDTPADCTDSSESWTTTGLTNPNTQKVTATFTPQVAGPIKARVVLYKPSYTVFVEGDARIA